MRFACLIISLLLLLSLQARARDFVVFHDGVPSSDYDSTMMSVHPGDSIVFEDQGIRTAFPIKAQIYPTSLSNAGSQNIIFELKNGEMFRMARNTENLSSITDFISGYRDLAKHGVQFMSVDLKRSAPGKYVIHEKLNIQFTLSEFLKSPEIGATFRGVNTLKLKEQLEQFSDSISAFEELGDFELTQVGWVNGRWVLFDYGHPNYLASEKSKVTPFSQYVRAKISSLSPAGKTIVKKMDSRIKARRLALCIKGVLLDAVQ